MRIRPGLCSITLRALSAADVISVAAEAGLECIEWGGDVHAPAGDVTEARRVAELTARAGLRVASYGSYFKAGTSPQADFAAVLASAKALGAPRIRIWAGTAGSAEAEPAYRRGVVEATQRAADLAANEGIDVAFEFHTRTLTDDVESTLRLLAEVDRSNVTSYWQPPNGVADADAVETLRRLGEVPTVHVFSWWPHTERLPLGGRSELWRQVFGMVSRFDHDVDALLEFVVDDEPANVVHDAAVLRDLIPHVNG